MRRFIFFIIFCTISFLCSAQEKKVIFKNLSEDNILQVKDITRIIQDKYGFIWIGTRVGLYKFDGKRVKAYHPSDQDNSLTSDDINCLIMSENGDLFIGTSNNLVRYMHTKDCFKGIFV